MKRLRLPTIFLLLSVFSFLFSRPSFSQSAELENVSVITNTMSISTPADLSVYFKLPVNASAVRRTEYIHIYLPYFTNISGAPSLAGTFTGTPQFSFSDGYVHITGITVVPGAQISINGISATTPATDPHWPITISITTDNTLTTIKNQAIVDATLNRGTVTISAIIETPEARLSISGYTSPDTYVTFTENQSVAGTDVSGGDGHFGKIFSGLTPGTHQYTFFGTDLQQRTTSPVTVTVYTPAFQETTVSNQILSPTIEINKNLYADGEDIEVVGSAVPDSSVTIFTQAPLRIYSTTADSTGNWQYTITNTEEYVTGDYSIYALAQSQSGLTSLNSLSLGFTISSNIATGTACGDITNGDLNCDGIVDLTDFSILMYYWGSANAIADINSDQTVNLTDFSILMYWWGT